MEVLEDNCNRRRCLIHRPVTKFPNLLDKSVAAPVPLEKVFCHFLCQICAAAAREPVLNSVCGHLFCWRCIYKFSNTSDYGEQCPACSAHMDISRGDDNTATIIAVHSGPNPGIYYCPLYESEPEEDEEETPSGDAVSCDDTYIPHPPMYTDGSRHASATKAISWLLHQLGDTVKLDVEPCLESLRNCEDHLLESIARRITSKMDRCIRYLNKGMQWALGHEKEDKDWSRKTLESSANVSELKQPCYEYSSRVYLWPTASEFPPSVTCFFCKICRTPAYEPVVTRCGHLFCWPCLYINYVRHPHNDKVGCCPVCSLYIWNYHGCFCVNPIYCGGSLDPEYEDFLLMVDRRLIYKDKSNIDEILDVPPRPSPALARIFMRHMSQEYTKNSTEIKKRFDELLYKRNNLQKEDVYRIAEELQDGFNSFHKRLTEHWENMVRDRNIKKLMREYTCIAKRNPVLSRYMLGTKYCTILQRRTEKPLTISRVQRT